MKQWHDILRKVLSTGIDQDDRTGVGTRSLFGETLIFYDVTKRFPAVTTKQLAFKQVLGELSCFLRGCDNLDDFHAVGCRIWDKNAAAPYWNPCRPGDLGRIYGVEWRDWRSVNDLWGFPGKQTDQLKNLVEGIKKDPYSRRHLVTAWNPGELDQMCLPPCHTMFQASVRRSSLDLLVSMRSVDLFLGLPFDVASYATLLMLLAKETGYYARDLIFSLGDAHIYQNHMDQARLVLERVPLDAPQLQLSSDASLPEFMPDQAKLIGYCHLGKVAAEMAL